MRKVVLLVAALFASSIAVANDWPAKPVRFIVPYPPGGGTDVIARILQSRLSDGLGHSVIVDNRGGAGGVLGTEAVAEAAADCYVFLITIYTLPINLLLL